MGGWVLVLFIHAGVLADTSNSVTMFAVEGFDTEKACIAAGEKSKALVSQTVKELRFICVRKS